jgi:glyoxylase-like metal-dependent hydrolase (beta-lactamase superfamily II)
VDCGHSVFPRLVQTGLADRIDAVLITHLHDDHVGSLSSFILYHSLVLKKGKLKIIYQSDAFLTILKDFLSFSLGRPEERVEFVEISEFPEVGAIDTFGQHVPGMSTWAFFFREGDEFVVYSGDLGNPTALFAELDSFQLLGKPLVFHEMGFEQSYGHTWFKELEPYLDRYRIYGYHNDQNLNPPENRIPLVADTPEFLI